MLFKTISDNISNFIPILGIIVSIIVFGTIFIWIKKKGTQDIIGTLILTFSLISITAFILEQSTLSNYLKILFDKIQYAGSMLLPLGLFLLTAKYANFNKIFKLKYLIPISIPPVIALFLVFTNELHKLMWTDAKLVLSDSFSFIVKEYNTLYFISVIYSSLLILTGIIITLINTVKTYAKPDGQCRWKKFLLIPYISIPWIITLTKSAGFNPFPYINGTPIIIAISTMFIIFFLNKTRIKEIMPETLETFFDNMSDGLILTDRNGNILKLNSASQKIFNTSINNVAGKPLSYLMDNNNDNPGFFLEKNDFVIGNNGSKSFFNTKQTDIKSHNGKTLGKIIVLRDITEIRKKEESIKYLSFYDKLTNTYNRAFFDIELQRLNSQRQMPLSLVLGDLNGLKLVNDTFGHVYGDKLIKKIADILKTCFRKEDIIARWGGDEFIILLPKTTYSTTMQIVERVHQKCRENSTKTMHISISTGIITLEKPSEDTDKLIIEAEDRMYRHKLTESQSARSSIISSLGKALEERDYETEEHTKRMERYSLLFGHALNLSDNKIDELSLLATLHDIGKIGIPDKIVLKPGKLTEEEWEIMRKHSEIGYRIALSSPDLVHIAKPILYHHERWDGKGYPSGLTGEKIPISSRVISIIDAYDAMTSDRPYRRALAKEKAVEEIKRCGGSQFDPSLVEVFMNNLIFEGKVN
jgi:diguanylate cyclase (GGDEF)-like protein/PAS domain S-box-containing protein